MDYEFHLTRTSHTPFAVFEERVPADVLNSLDVAAISRQSYTALACKLIFECNFYFVPHTEILQYAPKAALSPGSGAKPEFKRGLRRRERYAVGSVKDVDNGPFDLLRTEAGRNIVGL